MSKRIRSKSIDPAGARAALIVAKNRELELIKRNKQLVKKWSHGKPRSNRELLDTIEQKLARSAIDDEGRARLQRQIDQIRNREKDGPLPTEIARLNALGWTDGKIADHLGLSRPTVCLHRNRFGIPPVPANKRAR
ncbi:MAG: helix-turn-helix domain-containing protein [Erythrobacter sp.]|jgi:DNA-binding NarL/FixJ family response regulator|nr:helix-turn-helix domain-containing protein [Erythrobacter sp.]